MLGLDDGSDAAASPRTDLVTLRDADEADAKDLIAVHAAAFPTDAEAKLVAELLDGYDVLFSIAAECDGRIVGHALLTGMTHEDGGSVRGLVGLAPIAVHPDFQGRGIGKALVREAIRQCKANRVTALFVLGEPGYYGPMGFQPASEQGLTSEFDAGDAFQVIQFRPDRPAPAGRVSYAPAFNNLAH
ncbi:GNAT family N-acetyltransferase [Algisphaera agarilytica]|uniref:GNAT family N-acetyltransferase n=1 Tax=Algisphaera agarilytica TaxID=1385975 RepID=UPI0036F25010